MKHNKFDFIRNTSLGGSTVAAISASLCCVGPLIAILFGASGLAAAGFLAKWRPALLALTVAFLALAWILTYRRPRAGADDSCVKTSPFAGCKITLWIVTVSALAAAGFPAFSSADSPAKQGANCCATGGSCQTGTVALQQNAPAIEKINTNLVSFYQVPLVCPAAPQIGCGSASKPLLLALEKGKGVSEAWLNRAGTVIAIVWTGQSTAEQRTGTVETFQRENQITLKELTEGQKQRALTDFQSGSGWYRGAEVDRLSEEEAGIIAARLVRRVQAKAAISQEKAYALQNAIATALKKRFTDDKVKQEQNALLKSEDGLQRIAGPYLDKNLVPILKEAIAAGLRPLSDEK